MADYAGSYCESRKRVNEIVNRLNKTKVEKKPDLKAEREAVNAAERAEKKQLLREKAKAAPRTGEAREGEAGRPQKLQGAHDFGEDDIKQANRIHQQISARARG
ncbi:hypothetical protein HPP92_023605 [Vanilla planifolia]|uniref:Uncharacterized protein n=1 Tax=Vanilla planifolia TaxID=51239 RepID=A0A835PTG9_VANPL|nr:hypothetical protein HPP92_023605 [Vanilla planifolia]